MSPHRSAQRRAKVIKLSAEGKTGSDIARRLGITRQRVQQIRDAENVQRLDKPHVARRLLIRGLIAEGMCGADMARQLDCSVDCIYADIRSLKLTTPEKAQLLANRSRAQSDAKKAAARKRLRGKMK